MAPAEVAKSYSGSWLLVDAAAAFPYTIVFARLQQQCVASLFALLFCLLGRALLFVRLMSLGCVSPHWRRRFVCLDLLHCRNCIFASLPTSNR